MVARRPNTKYAREASIGCLGCRPPSIDVCPECSGWVCTVKAAQHPHYVFLDMRTNSSTHEKCPSPLVNLGQVLTKSSEVEAPASRRRKLQKEIEGSINHFSPLAKRAKDCIDALHKENYLLVTLASASWAAMSLDANWIALRRLLA